MCYKAAPTAAHSVRPLLPVTAGTLERYPGVRWLHYSDSGTFFKQFSNLTNQQCTQGERASQSQAVF
jgi:hypothetical protein